ncbi:hypothetical protein conserved [Leishmania donovani]|uniref:Uncharacterized protein n=2 Tax=Leishmania donovani TaxID=5661 RepID=A0A504XAA8_LEIDO|nr:hypothetical protein CGC20_32230 [Leishmania donovani]CAJ1990109.1 hypothetical protein conserved [Leishmania donovani]
MFAACDPNRVPVAPSVKIPTLSSPNGGDAAVKVTDYSPSTSMKRRHAATRPPGTFAAAEGASPLPATELCVHECSTETAALVESPPWHEWGESSGCGDDGKLHNELFQLEETAPKRGGALQTTPADALSKSSSVIGSGALQTNLPIGELLLQKEEFLERLVQRVRASCAGVPPEHSASTCNAEQDAEPGAVRHRETSPPPRRLSLPGVELADGTGVRSSDAGHRSLGRSRSRSLSLMSASSTVKGSTLATAAEPVQAQADALAGRRVRAAASATHQRSRATSPDPRPPSTDLYATGGALRSSLQYGRCSGVSRGRRSLSAERPDHSDTCAPLDTEMQETEEVVNSFWGRAAAASTGTPGAAACRSLSGIRSESVHNQLSHPQWNPHPVQAARPAWNQRQPQRKQRPVVSVPGSKPPSSARRCASRSPETSTSAQGLRGARSEERDSTGASHRRAGRALRRTDSLSLQLKQKQTTAPRRAAGQSPGGTAASPLSPPSARALFQIHDAHSIAKTTSPLGKEQETALQSQCDAALARATQAERQCNILSHALEQLLVDHAAEKAAWEVRHAALEQRLVSITEWISGIDAEANLDAAPQEASITRTPETATSDTTTPQMFTKRNEVGDAALLAATKNTAWEEDVDIVDLTNNSSPLPGAPGATPTPARHDSANADCGNASTCQVHLPPSPPLILHMHAAATQ